MFSVQDYVQTYPVVFIDEQRHIKLFHQPQLGVFKLMNCV